MDNDAFWAPLDHTVRITPETPPNSFTSGWYDFMLDQLLRDYQAMVRLGHQPHLTIGPWFHVSSDLQRESVRQTFDWMDHHLLKSRKLRQKPVRIHVSGVEEWHEFEAFPPEAPRFESWFLHEGGTLGTAPPGPSAPSTYRYDPADPTPAVGGAMFAFTGAGPVDQAALEARKDVLVFTSAPVAEPLALIGQPEATISLRADLPTADLFVRLSDVDPAGRSVNITDGYRRLTPADPRDADGVWQVRLTLHHLAHVFRPGHRLRVLVASGAHPRFARNTGTLEPLKTATALEPAEIEIFHDSSRPSAVQMPVVGLTGDPRAR